MKNLTFYKSVLAFVTMATMTLFSGCSSNNSNTNTNNNNESTQQVEQKDESCRHLTVYFENESVTFKECEGYKISTDIGIYSSEMVYRIYTNDEKVLSGTTTLYNSYHVNHNVVDELVESEPVEKVK